MAIMASNDMDNSIPWGGGGYKCSLLFIITIYVNASPTIPINKREKQKDS